MYSLNSAAQKIVSYWKTSRDIPFKGQLIDKDDNGNVCMCAQGQALHIVGGYTQEQLFDMSVPKADKETARILGISLAHSVFLRIINDNCEGSPQDVLSNPAKYLGPNWEDVLNFWIYLDTLSNKERKEMGQRFWGLDVSVLEYARDAARDAAIEVVGWEFINAAWRAAVDVTGRCIFSCATYELIGHHKLLGQGKTPLALQYCNKP
jgi:hypothetical protein